jgi:hypothetical protein
MNASNTFGLLHRRAVLRIASLSVAGSLLPAAQAATERSKARSVIVLGMAGGVTHLDSFDPKPDAPAEIRGRLSSLATTLPGVRFSETLPNLAKQTQLLALVRTFSSGNDDHFLSQAFALSGRRVTPTQITTEPNVGSAAIGIDRETLLYDRQNRPLPVLPEGRPIPGVL